MTHDTAATAILNAKLRVDALHTFVSGLKMSLKQTVFPAQPQNLPIAVALAQETKASNDHYMFAANYARYMEDKSQKPESQRLQG